MENQTIEVNKTRFSGWLADPAGISFADAGEITSLAERFPYCQILQYFRAKSASGQPDDLFKPILAKASLYSPKRKVLFDLVNHPEKFRFNDTVIDQGSEQYYEVIEDDDYRADLKQQEAIQEGPATASDNDDLSSEESEKSVKPNKETVVDMNSRQGEDKVILENIAGADFFAFDEKVDLIQSREPQKESAVNSGQDVGQESGQEEGGFNSEKPESPESNEMARYDDDSMPYSFLWWLHKTRKEHADTYQPYVDFKLDLNRSIKKTAGPELNQQIIENIFHLQSPLEDMEKKALPQTIPFELKRKEEDIIEKFIREEPQIHPPSPDKLDLENKARKSAEDPNDLVSETLASIYTEQMLFHKAIDTYQKLSLKFPEKKAYFADQISELQKKIN